MEYEFKNYYEIGKLYKKYRKHSCDVFMPRTPMLLQEIKDVNGSKFVKDYVFYSFMEKKSFHVYMRPDAMVFITSEMDLAIRKIKE